MISKGYIYTFLYMLTFSLSTVYVHVIGAHIDIISIFFFTNIVSFVCLLALNVTQLPRVFHYLKHYPIQLTIMTIVIASCWYLTYLVAIHSSAIVSLTLMFLSNALIAALRERKYYFLPIYIIIAIGFYIFHIAVPIDIFYGTLSGCLLYVYWRISKHYMVEWNIGPKQILLARYLLIAIVMSIVYVIYHHLHPSQLHYSCHEYLMIIIVGFSNQLLPNLFSQSGIKYISVNAFSFLVSFIPLLVLILNYMVTGTGFNIFTIMLCVTSSMTLNLSLFSKMVQKIRKTKITAVS